MKRKITAVIAGIALALGGVVGIAPAAHAGGSDCGYVMSGSRPMWWYGDNGNKQLYYPGASTCGIAWVWVPPRECIYFFTPHFTSSYCNGIWVDIPSGLTRMHGTFYQNA